MGATRRGSRHATDRGDRCHGCDLYQAATQAISGEGAAGARVVLVGEQPGDVEDRESAYVTNAVKHFRFERSGKRRIQKPDVGHIVACGPWLDAELATLDPEVVVVLGAVAARALLGTSYKVSKERRREVELEDGTAAVGTVHPSAVLRSRSRDEDYRLFVDDLRVAAALIS